MKKYAEKLMTVFAVSTTVGVIFLWVATISAVAHAMGIKDLEKLGGLESNLIALLSVSVPMAYFMFLIIVVDKKVTEWAEK